MWGGGGGGGGGGGLSYTLSCQKYIHTGNLRAQLMGMYYMM